MMEEEEEEGGLESLDSSFVTVSQLVGDTKRLDGVTAPKEAEEEEDELEPGKEETESFTTGDL
jgi:hypothetical protein